VGYDLKFMIVKLRAKFWLAVGRESRKCVEREVGMHNVSHCVACNMTIVREDV
jgi:hypothetical protein